MGTDNECKVDKKGCYGKLKKGQLFYRVRVSDGSEVLICHPCLRGGAEFEALTSSGVQGSKEEAKAAKPKPAKRENVVDLSEQARKQKMLDAIAEATDD